eukprot:jgi/Chrzof1/1662/Cz10g16100.t1
MLKPSVFQNTLQAVPHPQTKTGHKDKFDPCNRSDKRNGGDFKRFDSAYRRDFARLEDKPVKFRPDGVPVSARRVPGQPLMGVKPPNPADLTVSRRLCHEYQHQSRVRIGTPDCKDPRRFKSVYSIVHAAPYRALAQPNPGIAAEDAKAAHDKLGLFK